MGSRDLEDFDSRWAGFVPVVQEHVDVVWKSSTSLQQWIKSDGSRVTSLDLRLDVEIRSLLAQHFPEFAVLSEEIGLLQPVDVQQVGLAIVDPIDGTESLISGRESWWVSVGLTNAADRPMAGWIYQPATHRAHDSKRLKLQGSSDFIVGLSPDRLTSASTAAIRTRLEAAGARLVETPHAVEKVAAVLERRAAATIHLPSTKSPTWHAWDLAAGFALAQAADLHLATVDGKDIQLDGAETNFTSAWICASDHEVWNTVREAL